MTQPITRIFGVGRKSLLVVCMGVWCIACWFATDAYFTQRADAAFRAEAAKAEQFVAATAEGFDRIVAVRVGIPRLLARETDVRRAFAHVGLVAPGAKLPYEERKRRWSADPALAKLNERLALDAADLGLSFIGLTDTHRNCFAASNGGTGQSVIGVSYADRDYDSSAVQARSGYRVTIGKQYGTPGMAFYSPVFDNGRKIGNVMSRLDLGPFLNWLAPTDAFLTDRNGVVVLASDSALIGSAAVDAPAHKIDANARQATYRATDIALLDIVPADDDRYPDLRRVPGRAHPVIHRSQGIKSGNEPTIHVFWPFPQRAEFAIQRNLVALGAAVGGMALSLLIFAALARRREHNAHLAEMKRAERRLTLLKYAIDQSSDAFYLIDAEHHFLAVNRAACEAQGYRREELLGKTPLDIDPDVTAEKLERTRRERSGYAYTLESRHCAKDGRIFPVELSIAHFDVDNVRYVIAIARDISERKATEAALRQTNARLEAMLEAIPDLLFEVDREGRYLDVRAPDPALLAAPREELLGRTIVEMLPPEAAAVSMAALREADSRGKSTGNIIRLDLPSGPRWFDVSVAKKQSEPDAEVTFVALSRDVTAHQAALEEARRLARVRGEFLAHMSHELRTPLNSIIGHVQLLQAESGTSERNAATLGAIRDGGERLLGMIDDILDLTRIEAGKLELHAEDVALATCARELADIVGTPARTKGLRLLCALGDDLPASVRTDPTRLRQVLTRLLANAVKFTQHGEVELRIERAANRLRFAVRDSGPGIAAEEIERLFRPFEPVGTATNRPGGAGLGLALAWRLARLLGGELHVDSQLGAGSTFWFDLPLSGATGGEAMQAAVAPTPAFEQVTEAPLAADEIPPSDVLRALHARALLGNMRDIRHEAARIAALAPAYRRFAARIDAMAKDYQSKALLAFVETYFPQPEPESDPT